MYESLVLLEVRRLAPFFITIARASESLKLRRTSPLSTSRKLIPTRRSCSPPIRRRRLSLGFRFVFPSLCSRNALLWPTADRAFSISLPQLDYISKKIIPATFKLIQAQDASAQADAKKDLVDSYKELTEKVKGPFFTGDEFGVVDIAIAPWFAR